MTWLNPGPNTVSLRRDSCAAEALFLAVGVTGKMMVSLYEPFSKSERFTLADVASTAYWMDVDFVIVAEGSGADPLIGEVEAFANQQWRLRLFALDVYDPSQAGLVEHFDMVAHVDD